MIADVIGGNPEPEVGAARLERRWVVSTQTFRRLRRADDIIGRVNGRTLWLEPPEPHSLSAEETDPMNNPKPTTCPQCRASMRRWALNSEIR